MFNYDKQHDEIEDHIHDIHNDVSYVSSIKDISNIIYQFGNCNPH